MHGIFEYVMWHQGILARKDSGIFLVLLTLNMFVPEKNRWKALDGLLIPWENSSVTSSSSVITIPITLPTSVIY